MAAKKVAKPKYRFCWSCSRQLQGNYHRVALVDGHEVIVHVQCARLDGLTLKETR